MQRLFLRMMAGDVKNTEPDFESRLYLPKAHKITTSQWAALVPEAYIWMVRAAAQHGSKFRGPCIIALAMIRITFRFRKSASTF